MPTHPGSEEQVPVPPSEEELSQGKDVKPGFRATLAEWQSAIDERIRTVLPNFSAFRELSQEVARLSARLDALEKKLGGGGPDSPNGQGDRG
jgi:hypothetical protein